MASNINHLMTVADLDGENRSVLVFRLTGEGLEETSMLRNDDQISSPRLPGLELKLTDIFNVPRTG